MMSAQPARTSERSLLHRIYFDPWWRGRLVETLLVCVIVAIVGFAAHNVSTNLAERQIASGFGFLDHRAGFDVAMALIPFNSVTSTHFDVLVVGIINSLLVSVSGIVIATVLGLTLGLMRLSGNWLAERLSGLYVEVIRNIPVLLQLLFWYVVVLQLLPNQRNSLSIAGSVFINNRGAFLPAPVFEGDILPVALTLAASIVAAILLAGWAKRRRIRTGRSFPILPAALALLVLPTLALVAILGVPLHWSMPVLKGFNFHGGVSVIPEFVALCVGLSLYSAAFICEIVRSGILSVSRGQTEAASALGLRPSPIMWLIVLPQALRVIIPPLTTQYLNLFKNSSLGIAIGYPEIVAIFAGTSLNQTGQALEIIAITMGFYLVVSILVSLAMNWYNGRVMLVGAAR